jgi:hypothetical protein
MEHLMALGVEPGDQDLAARSLAALKAAGRREGHTREDFKKSVDRFAAQIPDLEEKKTPGQQGSRRAY